MRDAYISNCTKYKGNKQGFSFLTTEPNKIISFFSWTVLQLTEQRQVNKICRKKGYG